jgi:anti-sigma factor (TIGR02949 family)
MNCKEFIDFLMDYLGGELPAEARSCFEEHLHECPQCVDYVDMYKQAVQLGRAVCCREEEDVPPEVPEDLVRAILAARAGTPDPT